MSSDAPALRVESARAGPLPRWRGARAQARQLFLQRGSRGLMLHLGGGPADFCLALATVADTVVQTTNSASSSNSFLDMGGSFG
jgi:hypothetical protein